jgi:hypothetical protein
MDKSKCRGIVQQGPRKGMQCQRDKIETGYCIYHQRNCEYDSLISLGKNLCNGFFRGCNNELSSDDLNQDRKFCSTCRLKKSGKLFPCKFNGCLAKIKNEEDKYCDKHVRELLRDNEKEKNIQYCDISRGCFNILTDDIKCTSCRNKEKQKATNEMTALRKFYSIVLPARKEKDELFEKQELIVFQIKEVWRNVQRNAMLKNRLFTLSQQDFEKLVIQPCYYCGFYSNCKFVGIDRIDNTKGYILNNCVPACTMCNMMKNVDHPCAFLDKIDLICVYRQNRTSIINKYEIKWNTYFSSGREMKYNEYEKDSKSRNIKFLLTKSQYDTLIHGECYICGICPMEGHRNGIDRYDNNEDYTFENSRTCCGHCNRMKRNYMYEDFIRKCIQIKSHNCDRTKFMPIIQDTSKLDNEYYTAEDIAKFLQDGYLTKFLEWCDEKKKSAEFKSIITYIASKLENNIVEQIRKELDNERARKLNHSKNPDKKHLHCATIYAWLLCGNDEEFLEWFGKQYEKTALFDKKFKELKNELPSMSREEGIKACKKFMYDEKSRRNSQKIRDEKYRNIVHYSPVTLSEIIKVNEPNIINEDNIVKNVIKRQVNEKDKFIAPKQWKVKDIYNAIIHKNESAYYNYLKENNNADFETQWNDLLNNVKNKSYRESEPILRNFIHWLRTIRHNELCAATNSKRALEKEDRQHYRADGVLILLKTKNLDDTEKFKKYTETYAGDNPDDPKWIKRWNSFISSVENESSDENKKKRISNFLMAQRKKKNDRNA